MILPVAMNIFRWTLVARQHNFGVLPLQSNQESSFVEEVSQNIKSFKMRLLFLPTIQCNRNLLQTEGISLKQGMTGKEYCTVQEENITMLRNAFIYQVHVHFGVTNVYELLLYF